MSSSSCRKTDAFISTYYKTRDKTRLCQYYNQNSKIIWNGNPMNESQFMNLSQPNFRISSYDVQDSGSNLLISVSGSVIADQKHLFSQVFLAALDGNGQLIILADIFRYV